MNAKCLYWPALTLWHIAFVVSCLLYAFLDVPSWVEIREANTGIRIIMLIVFYVAGCLAGAAAIVECKRRNGIR
jgi:hypothetical protein